VRRQGRPEHRVADMHGGVAVLSGFASDRLRRHYSRRGVQVSLAEELFAAYEDKSLAPELRALLRRAAERISEAELDADYLQLIREMNEAGQQPFGINEVVKDWLIGRGRLPFEDIDEDTETKGNA
jgi:hypothetical protein